MTAYCPTPPGTLSRHSMLPQYCRHWILFGLLLRLVPTLADQSVNHQIDARQSTGGNVPIIVSNQCGETIWPGIVTQGGSRPTATGFELTTGSNRTITVASDWQGRVWGRTNCTFTNGQDQSRCTTGDCGQLDCKQAGNPPATLAEFTLDGAQDTTFYDISLVDGYNLPLAIVMLANGNSNLASLSPSTTNPSCVGSVGNLAPTTFNPYANNQQFLGTSSSDPGIFQLTETLSSVASWCPWDLQVNAPTAPGGGVYPYPEGNVQRPAFDPCLSACAKYNKPQYCCTGSYDGSGLCAPNYYATAAKTVCPDAYSYAYDDASSTFSVPSGAGFQVIFCPGGRSTNIIASKSGSAKTSAASGSRIALISGKPLIGSIGSNQVLLAGILVFFFLT